MGIYVWGTGCGASELLARGFPEGRITAFVDSFPGVPVFLGKPVLLPEQLPVSGCELLIITTRHADAVAKKCEELGIPPEKRLFFKDGVTAFDRNEVSAQTAQRLLGTELAAALLPRQRVIALPDQLSGSPLLAGDSGNDFVRLGTLELLCRRLTEVPGAAAELGVFRGEFARCINVLLPERKLYLFDSFQGFAPDAGAGEAMQAAHENTSAARVLAALPHPEQAVVKPGFFPASLDGLEETFCLVSLDVDFVDTTLEGLRYFYPRLVAGGYLLLHDWGNPALPGVAQALECYRQETDCWIPAVPLPDRNGTLVLCKSNNAQKRE